MNKKLGKMDRNHHLRKKLFYGAGNAIRNKIIEKFGLDLKKPLTPFVKAPHIGPFNKIPIGPARSQTDQAGKDHDIAYGEYR